MHPEIEKLIDHSFEYAQELLVDTKEFYPFAANIDTIGNVHPLEFEFNPKKMPQVGVVLESLTKYCDEEIANDRMHAYAMVYEANIQLEEGQDPKTCIAIEITHQTEKDIPKFYMPFNIKGNEVVFEEMFAVK